jgi:hypothetical protein
MENTNKYYSEITPEIEESSIQIFTTFKIKWENKEYHGTFTVTVSENIGIEEYGIEWEDESPNFGEFEDYIYEELEEKLLDKVLKKYNIP